MRRRMPAQRRYRRPRGARPRLRRRTAPAATPERGSRSCAALLGGTAWPTIAIRPRGGVHSSTVAGASDLPVRTTPAPREAETPEPREAEAREAWATLEGSALGDFVVVERLGDGGHGVVYRAEQRALGREAVIKVLHERHRDRPETVERFLREARLASRLDHPYAAHIYGFGAEPDGLLWIAMEHVRGQPLDRWIARHGAMPLERFVPFLERLCEVVHTAHEQGIIHRDIKPANVMVLARAGRLLPKLLDFGVAKAIGDPPAAGEAHRLGTPAYMAPELWLDPQQADARSDLYAVAALACEVLTGQPVFRGDSLRELAIAHAHQVPSLGAGFPAALDAAMAHALAKRPADRFASLLEFSAAVRAASGVAGAEAPLPRLDDRLRDALIAAAPQPIAEAVSILDGARSAHQALDALWQIVATALRYLALIALAARTRTPRGPTPPETLERLRALRRRTPSEDDWRELLDALIAGDDPEAHPVPELVAARAEPAASAASIDALLALRSRFRYAAGASETTARALLGEALPALEAWLRRFEAVWSYPLVAGRGGAAEQWMGLRRPLRPTVEHAGSRSRRRRRVRRPSCSCSTGRTGSARGSSLLPAGSSATTTGCGTGCAATCRSSTTRRTPTSTTSARRTAGCRRSRATTPACSSAASRRRRRSSTGCAAIRSPRWSGRRAPARARSSRPA
ncbi:MAG: serine/threonine protein kinase [Deltaproteobacteria bacterium]|nr:MAG: serine/threonine protein kinase [Deltaproteobacteria bacterium]